MAKHLRDRADVEPDDPHLRMRRFGIESLSDAELLALAFGSVRGKSSALALAIRVLRDANGARGLLRKSYAELAEQIGELRARGLVAAIELAERARATPLARTTPYGSSRDVVGAYGPRLAEQPDERVLGIVLDTRHRPLAERQLAAGGPGSCLIGVREVFALAVREGGAALVLVHNHPSGDPTPSSEDVALTRALDEAGRILGVPLLDHVIVAREGSFSFLDAGLLGAQSASNGAAA